MEYGARNKITAKVKSIKKGDVMALVKYKVTKSVGNGVGLNHRIR